MIYVENEPAKCCSAADTILVMTSSLGMPKVTPALLMSRKNCPGLKGFDNTALTAAVALPSLARFCTFKDCKATIKMDSKA